MNPKLRAATIATVASIIFTGAIFGFFYAWICSTMWGLGNADPQVAIEAMNAMNASVRNWAFFPAFFLTPLIAGLAAYLAHRAGAKASSRFLVAAAIIYAVGGIWLTSTYNLPLNASLADVTLPLTSAEAEQIWADYTTPWQRYNITRTFFSAIALLLSTFAALNLHKARQGSKVSATEGAAA